MTKCTEGRFLQKTGSFPSRLSAQTFPVHYRAVSSMTACIWCPGSDNRARRLLLFAFLPCSVLLLPALRPPGRREPRHGETSAQRWKGSCWNKNLTLPLTSPHPSSVKFEPWAGFESLWWMINREMALVKQGDCCRACLCSCDFCSSRLLVFPPCVPLMGDNQQTYL